MKTNPIKKLVIAGMGAAMIAAAVGSIGGTVAWFQYNTRATAAYTGAAAKCTENLQIRIYDPSLIGATEKPFADIDAYNAVFGWSSELTTAKVTSFIQAKRGHWDAAANAGAGAWVDSTDTGLYPVTSGALAANKVATNFYGSPDKAYAREDYATWDVAGADKYVEIPLQFRLLDVDGVKDATTGRNYIAENLYLTDLTLQAKTVAGKKDITKAIRIAFKDNATTPIEKTLSVDGGETVVHGNLDLDQDGVLDKVYIDALGNEVKYDFQADTTTPTRTVDYGAGNPAGDPKAVSTKIEVADSTHLTNPIADFTDKRNPVGNAFGVLVAGNDNTPDADWFTVNMKIYLEGWQLLDGYGTTTSPATDATLWDDVSYVGSQVNLGLTFNVPSL